MAKGYGDRLAGGGVKANFSTSGSKISDSKWSEAFDDFDAEKFRGGDSGTQKTRDAGTIAGKDKRTRK